MSLTPGSINIVRASPAGADQVSMTIVLPSAVGIPTVIDFKNFVGAWLAWCPEATDADLISVKCMLSGSAALVATDLNVPAAAETLQALPFDVFRGDDQFLIDAAGERVSVQAASPKIYPTLPQWTQFAFQWNGAADSYLVLRRVGLK